MINQSIVQTKRIAKKQLTWLRNWPKLNYFDSIDKKCVQKITESIKRIINF